MSGERLKPVTALRQLRVGINVVGNPCGQCGGEHRGKLSKREPSVYFPGTDAFVISPQPSCVPKGRVAVIDLAGIKRKSLFVVDRKAARK